jgi:hypothetical protein
MIFQNVEKCSGLIGRFNQNLGTRLKFLTYFLFVEPYFYVSLLIIVG